VSQALFETARARGGLLAACARRPSAGQPSPPGPPQIAAAGPRAAGNQHEYELLLEMIFEGSLLHYGKPRVIHTDDPDLALLLGDQLYALGLARLAALGDLQAVEVLASVISEVAQAHAEGEPERADAIWEAGARAVGGIEPSASGPAGGAARASNLGRPGS
jgi:hypothetical protein